VKSVLLAAKAVVADPSTWHKSMVLIHRLEVLVLQLALFLLFLDHVFRYVISEITKLWR
jgi:hypothetical protein